MTKASSAKPYGPSAGKKRPATATAPKRAAASKPALKNTRTKKYEIIGKTRDGVSILGPVVDPTHFTPAEIRRTIRQVLGKE
ncbi:hypothetical protein CCR97_25020 [Rhodoplanes elegans]|uniref:Uncharacterized protein n=2 Tax=Rhodoplanes elegans TaxID=29408 RepID=A0A327KJK6_9BRAD|nr:hypothetical protein [Rhodoplanes elegans]RAI37675.1 hypothetical protein CH338_15280 [Rhodoplanes elegans]